jgi:MFS family permease
MNVKWRMLLLLALAELLGMAVWFSASAVVPALTTAWELHDAGRAWLTISVQLGFVVGAFGSALLNLADRVPARRLLAASALLAALATALIPLLTTGLTLALPLRFLTGLFLAGVYPVGMKIMATWTKEDRGLGIGLLVGALTLGSASPHLLNALGGVGDWKPVLYLAAALAALGVSLRRSSWLKGRIAHRPRSSTGAMFVRLCAIGSWCCPTLAISATCGNCSRCGRGYQCFFLPASRASVWARCGRAWPPSP